MVSNDNGWKVIDTTLHLDYHPDTVVDILIGFYSFFYWCTQVKAHGNKHFHIDVLKAYIKEYVNGDSSNIYKEYLDYKEKELYPNEN